MSSYRLFFNQIRVFRTFPRIIMIQPYRRTSPTCLIYQGAMDNYESVMDSDQISARENPLPLLSIIIEKKKPTRTPTRTILKYYAGKLLSSPHTAYTYILSLCQGKHFSFSFLLSWAPQRYRNPKNPHPPQKNAVRLLFKSRNFNFF